MNSNDVKRLALAVIDTEARAVANLAPRIGDNFVLACKYLSKCKGRIIVTGMGKSGHVASKIAATFASTGSPAFFVHSGEASHGDLGMITNKDVVLALSHSGETNEILTILPLIKRMGVPLIALTGNCESRIAKMADVHIDAAIEQEACPLNLAPTASTTVAMVLGDALAVALLQNKGFTEADFALSHPGGSLGRRLLLHVRDIMVKGKRIPTVLPEQSISAALMEMTSKELGMTLIVDDHLCLLGIFTDGDLRRTLDMELNLKTSRISEVMTPEPFRATAEMLAAEALRLMDEHKINCVPVVDNQQHVVGAISMHDLLRAGVI